MQNDEPKTNHEQNENFKISNIDPNIFPTETGETELLNPVQKYLKNYKKYLNKDSQSNV